MVIQIHESKSQLDNDLTFYLKAVDSRKIPTIPEIREQLFKEYEKADERNKQFELKQREQEEVIEEKKEESVSDFKQEVNVVKEGIAKEEVEEKKPLGSGNIRVKLDKFDDDGWAYTDVVEEESQEGEVQQEDEFDDFPSDDFEEEGSEEDESIFDFPSDFDEEDEASSESQNDSVEEDSTSDDDFEFPSDSLEDEEEEESDDFPSLEDEDEFDDFPSDTDVEQDESSEDDYFDDFPSLDDEEEEEQITDSGEDEEDLFDFPSDEEDEEQSVEQEKEDKDAIKGQSSSNSSPSNIQKSKSDEEATGLGGRASNDSWRKNSEVGEVKNIWDFSSMEELPKEECETILKGLRAERERLNLYNDIKVEDIDKAEEERKKAVKERLERFRKARKRREEEELKEAQKEEEVLSKGDEEVDEKPVDGKEEDDVQLEFFEKEPRVEPKAERSVVSTGSNESPSNTIIDTEKYASVRDLVKKRKGCTIEEALKYFSKGEVDREIKLGRVVLKNKRLFI